MDIYVMYTLFCFSGLLESKVYWNIPPKDMEYILPT